MKERKEISEKDGIQKEWYAEARQMTADKLPAFIDKLINEYQHDYGTICHAIAAGAIAGAWAVEKSPQGGITGFQAGAIMWEMIRHWGVFGDGPKRMVTYNDMLYPQYESKFTTISKETAEWLKAEAQKWQKENQDTGAAPRVREHIAKVAEGWIPFGYSVSDE